MRGSGEENNNGSGCGDKNRMRAVDGKQEIYLEWPNVCTGCMCTLVILVFNEMFLLTTRSYAVS